METTTTIRGEINKFLQDQRMTINQFARVTGINSGTLSSILNGNRPISMNQLERITEGMQLEEGYFYELYIYECIFNTIPNWRRLGSFLERCAELDKLKSLHRAAGMVMENINYASLLFEMAEVFFNEEKYKAAAILYECVAESEKYQHSERLGLCHYRIFIMELGDDAEKNLRLAITFEPYIDKLDEFSQLEAYRRLININLSLLQWNTVKVLARKLGHIARLHYKNNKRVTILHDGQEKTVIFYILYSYLIQANVCREAGNFEEELEFISLYEYPDWIIAPSDQEQIIISQFKDWAIANRYLYRMMSGYSEAVEEYVNYIKTRKDEIFVALCNVVVAANRHHFNIDHILEQFSKYQTYKQQKSQLGKISEHITISRYNRLLSELGIYYLNSKQYDSGLSYILDSLEYSIRIKSDNGMLRCMGIFEQFRHSSSEEILKRYEKLIREVQKLSVYAWSPQVEGKR